MNNKKTVVISLLGTVLDNAKVDRWSKWRPTVSICQHEDLLVHRLELLYPKKVKTLADMVSEDIKTVSPETEVKHHFLEFNDAWDFEEVYEQLHHFSRNYSFDPEQEDYLVHITTGTHVAQICLFLLTEAHYLPGRLLQTSPPKRKNPNDRGTYSIIDLDLSKYDGIASRFRKQTHDDLSFLKSGIETRNQKFNSLIEEIEHVAINSSAALLLAGPTGAGKSRLARRIYELKKVRKQILGQFVEVNCATLRGDAAMSALFGHVKGAFTGALKDRPGLLKTADKGVLFLDEIGELGVDEQAMLLRALEEKVFLPVGADKEVESSFQLICGTNRDLKMQVREGKFREDLLARINLWAFNLPGLRQRPEDIEPNIEYELDQIENTFGKRINFNKEAKQRFLEFAVSNEAVWSGNFRDLNGAIVRMATLVSGGRITTEIVEQQIERLRSDWAEESGDDIIVNTLGKEKADSLDLFDKVQLAEVIKICKQSKNISDAGRMLFACSRQSKANCNDADRIRKYLARFGLAFNSL